MYIIYVYAICWGDEPPSILHQIPAPGEQVGRAAGRDPSL